MSSAKLTSDAKRWLSFAIKKSLGEMAEFCELENLGEGEMVEAMMPVHQFLLHWG